METVRITHEMPTKGQFIAFWKYDGELFSSTLLYRNRTRYVYDEFEKEMVVDEVPTPFYDNALFIVNTAVSKNRIN